MYKCVKCGELLGDEVRTCFRCHHTVTDEEYHQILRENEMHRLEAMREVWADYGSRRRKYFIATLVFLVVSILLMSVGVHFLGEEICIIAFLVLFVGYSIFTICQKIYKCPLCGSFMGRRSFWDRYCPRCGGQYRA